MKYECSECGELFRYKVNKDKHENKHKQEEIWIKPTIDDLQL